MDPNNLLIQCGGNSIGAESYASRTHRADNAPFRVVQILLVISGLVLLAWASSSGTFHNADNVLNGKFCLPLAISFGLIATGSFIRTKWKYFVFWSALALIGQSASLQLIDAGRLIHFQHYRSLTELSNREFLPLCLITAQIVAVSYGIKRHLPTLKIWFAEHFKIWQLIIIALFLILAGAAVTPDVSIYTTSIFLAAVVQSVNLANIILLAWSVPEQSIGRLRQKIKALLGAANENTQIKSDRFSLFAALWIVILSGTLSYFVYENHPHVPDEAQYLFQAKYMAAGQLTVKPPHVPEAFSMYMVSFAEDRWFSIFPPGWSAMLAVGEKINLVWLVNPLLAGICILLAYRFFQEIYSRSFARMAVLLLCCSPWFVFLAMSFMSHIFTLVCALSAAVLLKQALKKEQIIYVFSSGLMIGIVSLIRPLDGAIVAGLLGIWTLLGFDNWKSKFINGLTLTAGTMTTAALVFPYNKAVTGSATLSPMDFYYTKYFWSGVMALGFGANRGLHWGLDAFPGHSPLEALVNAALNVFLLNTELFGWSAGSLLFAAIFVFSGTLRKTDVWMVGVIVVVVGSYSLFWYHGGPDFGARYWFLTIVPLVGLTVRGIEFLSGTIDGESAENPRVLLTAAMLCALSLMTYFPWRALDKYYHYLDMEPDIRQLARQHNFGKSLVLIRGAEHPDYQSAWIYNPLDFEGDAPLYARDTDAETRAALLQAYSNRPVWIIDGPTITHEGYKITRGPVNAEQLLAEANQ